MGVDKEEERKGSDDEDDWWESMMPKLPDPKKKSHKKKRVEEIPDEVEEYTEEEMKVLVEEVTKREEALFGEYGKDEHPCNRWRLWLEVAEKVNDVSIKHRSVEQVRIKWFEHKDPAHKNCALKKAIFSKRSRREVSERRYRQLHQRLTNNLSLTDYFQGAKENVTTPQTNLQTQDTPIIVSDDDFGPYGEPIRKDKNDSSSEDITIIDEVSSKDPNREYELIVIDDENGPNEGGEPNTSLGIASEKEVCQSNDDKGLKIVDVKKLIAGNDSTMYVRKNPKLSEEERVKEWLELTDEERKARIKKILNNLKDPPKKRILQKGGVSSLKTYESPRIKHPTISRTQNLTGIYPAPSVEKFKNAILPSNTIAEKGSVVPSAAPSESSSNTNPSDSNNTNLSGQVDNNIINVCNNMNSSGNNIGKISEVFSLVSAEEFQNLSTSNTTTSNKTVLVPNKSVDKLPNQQPLSNISPSNVISTVSVPSVGKSKDSSPLPTTKTSSLVAVPVEQYAQNLKILQPFGTDSSNTMNVVPVHQQILPQIFPQVVFIPNIASEQVILGKVGETVKNTKNINDSSPGSYEDSSKEIMSSSTSITAGSDLLREIFGVDSTSKNPTLISKQPGELFQPVPDNSTLSYIRMEIGDETERNITSVSKIMEANAKYSCSNDFETDAEKANSCQTMNMKVVSEGSSHENTKQSTSSESIIDGLKQMTERPTKVYSGKSALQKRMMQSAPGLSENKRKQTLQPSNVLDLTKVKVVGHHDLHNKDGNAVENVGLVEIKDPVSGKSFLMMKEKPHHVPILEKKSMVLSQKGDEQKVPSNFASNTNEINEAPELKQEMNKNVMEKLSLKPFYPSKSPICVIQGDTIQMPKQGKVETPKIPILLRKNLSKPLMEPVRVIKLPREAHASTSGIEKKYEASLKLIQQLDTQKLIPVNLFKASDEPASSAVASQGEKEAPVKETSTVMAVAIVGRKKSRKDLGVLRSTEIPNACDVAVSQKNELQVPVKDSSATVDVSTEGRKKMRKDLGQLRLDVLENQPVVLLKRISMKTDEEKCV